MSARIRVVVGTVGAATLLVAGFGPAAAAIPPVTPSDSATPSPTASTSRNAPVMVVMDASGSMTTADAPGPRIDAAKKAVNRLVSSVPPDAQVGLEVYGTSTGSGGEEKAAGCRDIKILQPVGRIDRPAFVDRVNSIKASGYTPIGESLRRAAAALPKEGPRSIVLVSDGEDTCAPPAPCEVARQLKAQGIDLAVHTIGFKVDGKARSQLQCIARATGGRYADADDGGSLGDALDRQVSDAIRGYRAAGTPIVGGDTTGGAPVLRPGQYLDRYAHGAETYSDSGTAKFYRVDLAEGDAPYVTATVVPPAVEVNGLQTIGIKVELRNLDQDGCTETDHSLRTITDRRPSAQTAVVAPGRTGSDESCLKPGPVEVRVERTGDAFVDRPTDVELSYRFERPADATALPPAAEPAPERRATVSGTPVAVSSGSSFNDAPLLATGVYADSVTPGETRYVKVHLDWGQRLSYSYSAAKQRGYGYADGFSTHAVLANPVRKDTDPPLGATSFASLAGAMDVGLHGSSPVPARYRNRESKDVDVTQFAQAGDYYLVLSTGFASSGRSQRVPYTLRVQVTGAREPGPEVVAGPGSGRTGSASTSASASASTSTSASGSPSRADGSPVAGRDERDPGTGTPLLVAGITAAVLLLGGLAGGWRFRRRRAPGGHTDVMPAGR